MDTSPQHPFYAGTYDDKHYLHCGVEDRLRVVAKADPMTLQTILSLPPGECQKTVHTAAERRLRKLQRLAAPAAPRSTLHDLTPILALCSLLFALSAPAQTNQTTPVFFNGLHFGGGQALGKKMTITPSADTLLQTDGTNIITGGPITLQPGAVGVVTNLWPGRYSVTIEGVGKGFTINVPVGWTNAAPAIAARLSTNLVTTLPPPFFSTYDVSNYVAAAVAVLRFDGSTLTNLSFGSMRTNDLVLAWTMASAYTSLAIQYDQNNTATNATVLWPDGTYGIWIATNVNATWLTPDGWVLTYTNAGILVAQPTMLRDQVGNVTNSPALLLYP